MLLPLADDKHSITMTAKACNEAPTRVENPFAELAKVFWLGQANYSSRDVMPPLAMKNGFPFKGPSRFVVWIVAKEKLANFGRTLKEWIRITFDGETTTDLYIYKGTKLYRDLALKSPQYPAGTVVTLEKVRSKFVRGTPLLEFDVNLKICRFPTRGTDSKEVQIFNAKLDCLVNKGSIDSVATLVVE